MNEGSVKLFRSILTSQVFAHQTALKIWIWCLCRATYKERFISLKIGKGETVVKLTPGQFIFGRFKAEEELSIDGSTIYKWMQKFASSDFDMITIQSNNQYSIITISKWEEYQIGESEQVTSKEQPSNNQVTTEEQPSNTNNKDNKVNKDNKERGGEKFIIPELIEVIAYCKERNNNIDPAEFCDFYQSKGWMIGKNKMKDWRAAIRTWEKKNKINGNPAPVKVEYGTPGFKLENVR